MEKSLSENKKSSVFKRVYRKIVFHLMIDNLVLPIISFIAVALKPAMLLMLKPIVAIMAFVSALAMGFVGFNSISEASEIGAVVSSELAEESGGNIIEMILNFFF